MAQTINPHSSSSSDSSSSESDFDKDNNDFFFPENTETSVNPLRVEDFQDIRNNPSIMKSLSNLPDSLSLEKKLEIVKAIRLKQTRKKLDKTSKRNRRLQAAKRRKRLQTAKNNLLNSSAIESLQEPVYSTEQQAAQVQLVDGKLVLNRSALVLPQNQAPAIDTVRSNLQSNRELLSLTTGSLVNRDISRPWNLNDDRILYKGIRMFGLDFDLLSTLFPDRTRQSIRNKYFLEKKKRPTFFNYLLDNPIQVDFEWMKQHSSILDPKIVRLQFPLQDGKNALLKANQARSQV